MKPKRALVLMMFLLAAFFLASCKPSESVTVETPVTQSEPEKKTETAVGEIEATISPTELLAETVVPEVEEISADPEPIEFVSGDDTVLQGVYYPPAFGPSPVVVLLHQYPLDHESEWFVIAPWLQNRGQENGIEPGSEPWGDPSWFPAVPDDLAVGVFVFTFRGCKGGCQNANLPGGNRGLWAEDARAAVLKAAELPGADPDRIVTVGTSIGADGAVDGCLLAVDDGLECAGAFSISPGDYLGLKYNTSVKELTDRGIAVRCLAGEQDVLSADTCRSFSGDGYGFEIDPSGKHGIALVDPDIQVKTLDLLLAFLQETTMR